MLHCIQTSFQALAALQTYIYMYLWRCSRLITQPRNSRCKLGPVVGYHILFLEQFVYISGNFTCLLPWRLFSFPEITQISSCIILFVQVHAYMYRICILILYEFYLKKRVIHGYYYYRISVLEYFRFKFHFKRSNSAKQELQTIWQ